MPFDDGGKIERIVPVVRNDAHKLIEECMLRSQCVRGGIFAEKQTHGAIPQPLGPSPKSSPPYASSSGLLGLHLGGGDKPTPKDYALAAEKIANRPDQELLRDALRSMQQAAYEPSNEGHFGLAYEAYAHFHLTHPPLSRSHRAPRH